METLLDIGGAPGITARTVAERFGMDWTVTDPVYSEAKAEDSDTHELDCPWELYPYEDCPQETRFDVILCCQTVDHLLDLKGGLEKMRGLLAEGGILWIDIVDWRYRLRRSRSVEACVKIDHPYNLIEETFEELCGWVGLGWHRKVYQGPHVGYICKRSGAGWDARDRRQAPWVKPFLAEVREIQARQK